ncbi:hypothetical protein CSIM01_11267 [Colletotrichum simmondsii]|uniref:Uncharacterized protein n=1 Tax=Colletotrichum simmondsii TaxID=703756 RepID=A0A135RU67_9PEZI|nr:hypothetical protein CSIM01_11267 [Colletotrichum simmondsii]
MANIPYQSSGTPVSQVENDVAQTLNLAGAIVTIIREPIAHIYETYNKAQKIRRSLGVWQKEILDENGQPRIPVLRHQEVENYLVEIDGIIPASQVGDQKQDSDSSRGYRISWPSWGMQSPESSPMPILPSAGTACWGYFLFALGIHPGMKTVSRRPSTDGFISTQNGGVEMEIEGSALCHVMNLYSMDRWDDHRNLCPGRRNPCVLSFGKLGWKTVGDQCQVHAHFSPGIEQELCSEKRPFDHDGNSMDVGTIMASYLTALHHGVSDQRFQLAAPIASLSERITRLLECFRLLCRGPRRTRAGNFIKKHDHRVVDEVLIFHMSGGDDRSFYDDVYELCSSRKEKDDLWEFFIFGGEGFAFLNDTTEDISYGGIPMLPVDAVRKVLLSYETCPAGSWKRDLFERREEVVKVAKIRKTFYLWDYAPMRILWYTPNSDIWKETETSRLSLYELAALVLGGRSYRNVVAIFGCSLGSTPGRPAEESLGRHTISNIVT